MSKSFLPIFKGSLEHKFRYFYILSIMTASYPKVSVLFLPVPKIPLNPCSI